MLVIGFMFDVRVRVGVMVRYYGLMLWLQVRFRIRVRF